MLDIHAPLRTGRRRSLSDDACQAKQLHRRLERRYRRSGLHSDKQAYLRHCNAARDSIRKSWADHTKDELEAVYGDDSATWRTAQRQLHSKHKAAYDDAESVKLVKTFCQFFADKVNLISDNISQVIQSSARRAFAVQPHPGPALSSFQPVTIEKVRKLLSKQVVSPTTQPTKSHSQITICTSTLLPV